MDCLALLLTGVIGFLISFLVFYKRSKRTGTIPGLEPSDPVAGNFPDIGIAGTLNDFQNKYHAKFGGIFSFWYGQKQVVSISHPDYIRDINHLDTRPKLLFEFIEDLVGPKSIQFSNGKDYWRRRAAYIDPAFGYRALIQYEPELFKLLSQDCFPLWKRESGNPTDLKRFCLSIAIKVITQVAFGDMKSAPELIDRLLHCYTVSWDYLYAKIRNQDSGISTSQYKECVKDMRDVCDAIVLHRKEAGVFEPFRFIDLLLKENDQELTASEMISFFIGGFHTTGFSLVWAIYLLAKHPAEQEKIRIEVETNVRKSQEMIGVGDVTTGEKFRHLRNVVEETIRIGRIAGFAGRVDEEKDIRLHDGKIIPKGTPILEALGIMSVSPGLWKDPMEFLPDRHDSAIDPVAFMPFGGSGKRVCPGKTFANVEIAVILANLIRHFSISFPPFQDNRVEAVTMLVTSMKQDLKIILSPRS